MDLSRQLEVAAGVLLREKARRLDVHLRRNKALWACKITLSEFSGASLAGEAVDFSKLSSFIKALSELGESIIRKRLGLNSRCGLAGGIIFSAALERAQSELIERDAFLFHYQSGSPGKHVAPNIVELASACPAVHVVLASRAGQPSIFTTGSGQTLAQAVKRAQDELLQVEGWTAKADPYTRNQHMTACLDPWNISRIQQIMSPSAELPKRGRLAEWTINRIPSPIRLFTFVQVKNEALLEMSWGLPEPTASKQAGRAVFLPYY